MIHGYIQCIPRVLRGLDYVSKTPDSSSRFVFIHCHPIQELNCLTEASRERRNESIDAAITITQHIGTARDVSRAMRSQYERKSNAAFDLTVPDFDLNIIESYPELPDGVDVEVRIERTVMLERRSRTYELEDYSRNARISRDRYA